MYEGYENLQRFLPFLDLQNVEDFSYRVNRRQDSKIVQDLLINRVNQWSVASLNLFGFTVEPRQSPQLNSANVEFASRLELDISTSQDRIISLPSEKLIELFDELVQKGLGLSEEGDIEQ